MFAQLCGRGRLAAYTFVILFLFSTQAWAQQPSITSWPSTVAAGPDYATDVLGNSWDLSQPWDLGQYTEEYAGWTITGPTLRTQGVGAFINNGRFVGTTTGNTNLISMLFRGATDVISSNTETVGTFDHKAIPTGRFGKVAVRMTVNQNVSGQMQAFWHQGPHGIAGGRAMPFGRSSQQGTHLYIGDLVAGTWFDDAGNTQGGAQNFHPVDGLNVSWTDVPLMRGFTLRATSAAASANVEVDWVRLVPRDGAAGAVTMPITFTGCISRPYSIEVNNGNSSWAVLYAATSSGSQTQTAQVNYAALAPGTYEVRLMCYAGARGVNGQASASRQVVVNDPPQVTVANPDATGGADYATAVKGNAWDMNALSDIAAAFGINSQAIVNDGPANAYQATSPPGSDPAVYLLNGPPAPAIDTARFRYLTFVLTVAFPGEISPARLFWAHFLGGGYHVATSQDIFINPGRNSYTIDLASLSEPNGLEPDCLDCANLPWASGPVPFFRLDPHELTQGVTFRLGPVTLAAADAVPPGGSFPVQFSFADADAAGAYQARVYLDTDRNTVNGGLTQVGTLTSNLRPNTMMTFNYSPSGIPNGEYYVYVEVQETRGTVVDTRGVYSSGPLRIGPAGPQAPGAPVLSATQIATNPVSVAWSPGPGDPPTSYVLSAGSAPGASNYGTFQMGLQTTASGNVGFGVPIYVRVTAFNAVGSSTSNEISFVAGPVLPGHPFMNPPVVSANRTVTLSWNQPQAGGSPTHYIVVARYPGSPTIIATLPVAGTSLVVPNVPPGSYVVTVVGVNAAGTGPESGGVVVNVP